MTSPGTQKDRRIRIFISSTFRDMQRERELLVKRVFPELRRICASRFVSFTEVDLRWGITSEQSAEGQVLPICLEEIHSSRPYFIGLLGERYGWIPDSVPEAVVEGEPWLQEHVGGRTSVTELEILHGVLNNPGMAGHAFFYFRDPSYVDTIPTGERGDFVSEDPESAEKLRNLKDRIRRSGRPVESYADPEALAALVRDRLLALVDRLYPEGEAPDALTQEALAHDAWASGKLQAYVERPSHTAVIEGFVLAGPTGQGMLLTGESGGGKTALLADWVRRRREGHPGEFVFVHYFGSTPESATVPGFLRRLLGELKRIGDIPDEIPSSAEKMQEALPLWLAQASEKPPDSPDSIGEEAPRINLVLDGLNQIEGDDPDRFLSWLPRAFPPHVRVVASALPGPALDALRERSWVEHVLPLVDAAERDRMIGAFFGQYRKTLPRGIREELAGAPGSANPLFLRTVLEELRQFGSFERLPLEVSRYLAAKTPEDLFRLVLRRWREDFDAGRELVKRAVRHLWAARQGLDESEWLELLGDEKGPMDRQTWRPLFLAMEPHLAQRGGLFAFGHDYLRCAVAAEYLPRDEDRRAAHIVLGDYFNAQENSPRKAAELPWQWRKAGERERLRSCLLDIPMFWFMSDPDHVELLGYWVWLGEEREMGQPYLLSFREWRDGIGENEMISRAANDLGFFLHDAALLTEAELLYKWALEIDERSHGKEHFKVITSLGNYAQLLQESSRIAEAEQLHWHALTIIEQSFGKDHPKVALELGNLGLLFKTTNRFSEAEQFFRRALEINERNYGKEHTRVAICLSNLAQLLMQLNRLEDAELLMRQALEIDQRLYGKNHPSVARDLNNLAGVLSANQHYSDAAILHQRALEIHEQCYGKEHPNVATDLNNIANLLQGINKSAEAEPLMHRALKIFEQSYGRDHRYVATALNNLAQIMMDTDRILEAELLMLRSLEILERIYGGNHPDVAIKLNNLAMLFKANNRLAEAEALMRRALEIDERFYGEEHPNVAIRLSNLAQIMSDTDRLSEAEKLIRRALEINERSYGAGSDPVANDINDLAVLQYKLKRLDEAESLIRRALEIVINNLRTTGYPNAFLELYVDNYKAVLRGMRYNQEQIDAELLELGMKDIIHAKR